MPTQSALQTAPVDSLAYAQSLYDYAAQRLDAVSLRCWIIQRLMFDEGLDHACAEDVFEHVLASALTEDGGRKARRRRRQKRFPQARTSPRRQARRRLHSQRPAGRT